VQILAVVLPLDEKKDVQTLLKGTCADSCNFSGENPVILLDDSDLGEATDVPLQKEQGTSTHGQNGLSEIKMEESETVNPKPLNTFQHTFRGLLVVLHK
jgi:hypothetical protein